ncbi:MAG: GNAT family N-acetyltransferase [Candidatus Nanopelagicales bacterium]
MATIHRAAFDDALPWIGPLHTPDEDLAYFSRLVNEQQSTVAQLSGVVAGISAYKDGWLNQLYVSPDSQGRGLGTELLHNVMNEHRRQHPTEPLWLWTFQANAGARRFYERHGFVSVEFTDGAANEEREPDVRYEWLPD